LSACSFAGRHRGRPPAGPDRLDRIEQRL